MSRLRILVADSNPDIRESMRQVVQATGAEIALAFAGDGQSVLNAAVTLRPHLAMIDIGLRNADVLGLVRHLHYRLPETRTIVMLTDDSKEYRLAAERVGASAVVAKAALNEDWLRSMICLLQDCPGPIKERAVNLTDLI